MVLSVECVNIISGNNVEEESVKRTVTVSVVYKRESVGGVRMIASVMKEELNLTIVLLVGTIGVVLIIEITSAMSSSTPLPLKV
jgi:hypothetical protein